MRLFWQIVFNQDAAGGAAAAAATGGGGAGSSGADQAAASGGGAGGAAAAAAAASGGNGTQAAAAGGNQQQAQQAAAYHPEGLAEAFRGANDRETIDKLAKHMAEMPKAPADPKDYSFKFSDPVAAVIPADDPLLGVARQVAFDLKMPDAQATAFVDKVFAKAIADGIVPKPMTTADFQRQLTDLATVQGDAQTRLQSGADRFHAVRDDLQGLVTAKIIDDAGFQRLFGLMDRDVGALPTLEALIRAIPSAGGPRGGGRAGNGQAVDAEQARLARMYPTMNGSA